MIQSRPVKSINKARLIPKQLIEAQKSIVKLNLNHDPNNKQDINALAYIIGEVLKYPSVEVAQVHKKANKLGTSDIKTPKEIQEELKDYQEWDDDDDDDEDEDEDRIQRDRKYRSYVENQAQINPIKEFRIRCGCCNLVQQPENISLGTSIDGIHYIGMSTILYFRTIRNLIILLLIMFLVFSLFAIGSNLYVSKQYRESEQAKNPGRQRESFNGVLATSLGSKYFYGSTFSELSYTIQCWLGAAIVLIWAIVLGYMKKEQKKKEYFIDYSIISAGDFALLFSEIPLKYFLTSSQDKNGIPPKYSSKPPEDIKSKELKKDHQDFIKILETKLNSYRRQTLASINEKMYKEQFQQLDVDIEIQQIHVLAAVDIEKYFKKDQDFQNPILKQNMKEIQNIKTQFRKIIESRKVLATYDIEEVNKLRELYKQKKQQNKKIRKEYLQKLLNKKFDGKQSDKMGAFVIFKDTRNKELIQRLHERQQSLLHKLPCIDSRQYLKIALDPDWPQSPNNQTEIKIEPAPEPEDISWFNNYVPTYQRVLAKVLTFAATAVILFWSFIFIFLVSEAQLFFASFDKEGIKPTTKVLSAVISVIILITSIIITEVIVWLTEQEKNITYTKEQTSMGVKCIFAVLINTILIPIAVNKILKNNLYGIDGLADSIYFQALSMALLTPILKVLNPSFIIYLIKRQWYNRKKQFFGMTQRELNKINEYPEFKIGAEYVEIVTMFLFACFYASLQPLVVPIIAGGLFLMYYAQKVSLLWFSKRPTPGSSEINTVMHYFIFAGPIFFSIGSLCWTNIFSSSSHGLIPNVLALLISIIIFFAPYEQITRSIVRRNKKIREATYQQDKLLLVSDYGRTDPITKKEAIKQYNYQIFKFIKRINPHDEKHREILAQVLDIQGFGYEAQQTFQQDGNYYYMLEHGMPFIQIKVNTSNDATMIDQIYQLKNYLYTKKYNPRIEKVPYSIDNENDQLDLQVYEYNLKPGAQTQIRNDIFQPETQYIDEDYDNSQYQYSDDEDEIPNDPSQRDLNQGAYSTNGYSTNSGYNAKGYGTNNQNMNASNHVNPTGYNANPNTYNTNANYVNLGGYNANPTAYSAKGYGQDSGRFVNAQGQNRVSGQNSVTGWNTSTGSSWTNPGYGQQPVYRRY